MFLGDLDAPFVRPGTKQAAELVMRDIDRLSPRWRELVYEYGYTLVMSARESGMDYDEAMMFCVSMHDRRQEEWLRTDFVTKKTARMIVEKTLRAADRKAA